VKYKQQDIPRSKRPSPELAYLEFVPAAKPCFTCFTQPWKTSTKRIQKEGTWTESPKTQSWTNVCPLFPHLSNWFGLFDTSFHQIHQPSNMVINRLSNCSVGLTNLAECGEELQTKRIELILTLNCSLLTRPPAGWEWIQDKYPKSFTCFTRSLDCGQLLISCSFLGPKGSTWRLAPLGDKGWRRFDALSFPPSMPQSAGRTAWTASRKPQTAGLKMAKVGVHSQLKHVETISWQQLLHGHGMTSSVLLTMTAFVSP
jgi:hypothetical protein